jgi:hypothetical protein
MDQQQAILHLRQACVPNPPSASDADLVAEWNLAAAKLGQPFRNAGTPDIRPIPQAHQGYIQQMMSDPWTSAALQLIPNHSIALVEIDPLLAFQFA